MNKKKIALLAMSICMIAILAVGGSLAFLTDYDRQVNVFTAGKVDIDLDECIYKEDPATGNLIPDGDKRTTVMAEGESVTQSYHLHPNMTVAKDPTITVVENSEDTYVGAIVTVSGDLYDLYPMEGDPTNSLIDINKIASGGLLDEEDDAWGEYGDDGEGNKLAVFQNDNYAVHQIKTAENEWKLYVFMKMPMADEEKVVLFDKLTIDPDFDNAKMAKLSGMKIEVQAYGVQADGFAEKDANGEYKLTEGCYNAMTEAFANDWPFGNGFKTVEEIEEAA